MNDSSCPLYYSALSPISSGESRHSPDRIGGLHSAVGFLKPAHNPHHRIAKKKNEIFIRSERIFRFWGKKNTLRKFFSSIYREAGNFRTSLEAFPAKSQRESHSFPGTCLALHDINTKARPVAPESHVKFTYFV